MRQFVIAFALVAAGLSGEAACADDAGIEFFEKKIRPLLATHCYECHSADAKKLGGGLLLDSRDGVKRGGESGAVVESGKPERSLLIKALRYDADAVQMPPKGKLPAAAIADFEEWVRLGVPDPRDKPTARRRGDSWDDVFRERAKWWSLQPVRQPALPQPKNAQWSEQPIDRFILAKLEENGLTPAESATTRTLARRLSLVLTGLPPTVEQVSNLLAKSGQVESLPHAIEEYVDSLLDSPQFGERWARHWMDVVRFTETHGNEWNYEVHHAWRYRDYLIRAFNADVPYDQLVAEHIAGDLLESGRGGEWEKGSQGKTVARDSSPPLPLSPSPTHATTRWHPTEHFNESVIGTGFFRFGEVNHDDCISLRELGFDIADNQIDTLTKAFQATTVACARCHEHKLDAVSMKDYYALLGIVRGSRMVAHTIDSEAVNEATIARLREVKSAMRRELASVWRQEAAQLAKYMLAAEAKHAKRADAEQLAAGLDAKRLEKWIATLAAEKQPLEDLFEPWRQFAAASATVARMPTSGRASPNTSSSDVGVQATGRVAERYAKEDRERAEFHRTQFTTFADFRDGTHDGWQVGGQGLRELHSRAGEFAVGAEGEPLVKGVLPAGAFTNAASDKLNGTLRSPVLPLGKKHISFEVVGQRSSAVRLVSNNCQLNYKNYRALTKPELHWVTFSPPDDRDRLRTYAELMTMFDNPKFPDQLAALGGDGGNYRLPWEKAAENPRSYFGVTRVVLHDSAEPPKAELSHLRPLFTGDVSADSSQLAARYESTLTAALQRWSEGQATDDDARWLDAFVRRELLSNQPSASAPLEELTKQFRQAESELALPRVSVGVGDGNSGFDQPVFVRGNCQQSGEAVPRRFLDVLAPDFHAKPFESRGSGRLELALQIASKDNPLTARVMVNRVWHHLFGTGLVRTVDDFGHVGEQPSHPELLDDLAARFVAEGWSVKRLIRSIVLSRTFQQSTLPSARAKEVDPQNRLLSHFPARRLEAEAIRDAMLATSGRLDLRMFGPSVQPFREKEYADRRLFPGPLDGDGRRSVYIKNNLMEGPKFLSAFNFPGGKVTQGRRDVTNVPAQALALLNDPFVVQQADVWAERLVARPDSSTSARVAVLFETALSRPPTSEELARFEQAAQDLATLHQVPAGEILKSKPIWKDLAHAVFNLKEFIYVP